MGNQFIDITDRVTLRKLLSSLQPDAVPLWGKMAPQQMVEHLAEEIRWTNGKQTGTCRRTPAEAEAAKRQMVYSDAELPKNFVLGELPDNYAYTNIDEAIDILMIELGDFDSHFKASDTTAIHGGFGPMDHDEWLIWHGKHFTHHFKQFGLI